MPDLKGRMTPQESAFVEAMVRTGDAVYSATVAGYAQPPSAASKALKRPDIVAAIQTAVRLRVRIPTEAGHSFRGEAGQRSDLMSATIPR